jgi:hypothetical protein
MQHSVHSRFLYNYAVFDTLFLDDKFQKESLQEGGNVFSKHLFRLSIQMKCVRVQEVKPGILNSHDMSIL